MSYDICARQFLEVFFLGVGFLFWADTINVAYTLHTLGEMDSIIAHLHSSIYFDK